MKAIWLTDIHLNFLNQEDIGKFLSNLRSLKPDGIFLTGDIGEAHNALTYLEMLADSISCPIYFVLGNHDFYGSSISDVREFTGKYCQNHTHLNWLPQEGIVELSGHVCLIGHEGWADGQHGDFFSSTVSLNDYYQIEELTGLRKTELLHKLHYYGDEAAAHFDSLIPLALEKYKFVIALMHVPPFLESSWSRGKHSDDEWAPHFTCKAVGDVMQRHMKKNPDKQMIVLCGHSHGWGVSQILPNLTTYTGCAKYNRPNAQRIKFIIENETIALETDTM